MQAWMGGVKLMLSQRMPWPVSLGTQSLNGLAELPQTEAKGLDFCSPLFLSHRMWPCFQGRY